MVFKYKGHIYEIGMLIKMTPYAAQRFIQEIELSPIIAIYDHPSNDAGFVIQTQLCQTPYKGYDPEYFESPIPNTLAARVLYDK